MVRVIARMLDARRRSWLCPFGSGETCTPIQVQQRQQIMRDKRGSDNVGGPGANG